MWSTLKQWWTSARSESSFSSFFFSCKSHFIKNLWVKANGFVHVIPKCTKSNKIVNAVECTECAFKNMLNMQCKRLPIATAKDIVTLVYILSETKIFSFFEEASVHSILAGCFWCEPTVWIKEVGKNYINSRDFLVCIWKFS